MIRIMRTKLLISGIHFCCPSLPFPQTSYRQAVTLTCQNQRYEFLSWKQRQRDLRLSGEIRWHPLPSFFLENPFSSTFSVNSPDSTLLYLFHLSVVTTGVPNKPSAPTSVPVLDQEQVGPTGQAA